MRFTIITVNYNNREGLEKTINSVISQNYKDYEFIIIDGGSTDGSRDVIRKYSSQISYWVSERDEGVYFAMNKGIEASQGEILNFMNSGDCFFDENTLASVAALDDSYDILVGRDYHFNEQTQQGFASILPLRVSMITFFLETLPHQSAFFKRKLFENGDYNTSLRLCADWALYIEKIIKEGCKVVLTPLIICRREQGGISTTNTELIKKERQKILNELLPKGAIQDYETLTSLDKSTVYKLFSICDNPKTRKWITLSIKIIHRLFLRA